MKKFLPILLVLCATFCACQQNEPEKPVASFTYKIIDKPFVVEFENNSTGLVGYRWDFGDGETSDDTAPTHRFSYLGDYKVKLTGYTQENKKVSFERVVAIKRPRVFISAYGIDEVQYYNKYYYIAISNGNESDYWGKYIGERTPKLTEDNMPYWVALPRELELSHIEHDSFYYVYMFWCNSTSESDKGTQCMKQILSREQIDRYLPIYMLHSDNLENWITLHMVYE